MNQSAVDFLNAALASGMLDDESENSFRESIARNKDHWYHKMVEEEGREVAETAFRDSQYRKESAAYGAVVKPLVESMVKIAQHDAEDELTLILSPDNEDHSFPLGLSRSGCRTAVVLTNPENRGCGCTAPNGSAIWGTHGSLKLFAIALLKTEHEARHRTVAQGTFYTMYLVFEPYKLPENAVTGYTLLEFGADGCVMEKSHYLYPEKSSAFFGRQVGNGRQSVMMHGGGGIESHFFPGASEYIAEHIPELPAYLSALVELMQDDDH